MSVIQVTMIMERDKDGKPDMYVVETDSLLKAVRLVLTFKEKRGYKVRKVMIEEVERLV